MEKICIVLFCYLLTVKMHSQNIKGLVYDEKKHQISGALVFLDGSSIGTLTDDKGLFELDVKTRIISNLVVNSIGFESKSLKIGEENEFLTIQMNPKTNILNEVVVTSKKSRFKRADKLKVFREEFLGSSTAAKSCKIINEEDINLKYDLKTKQLIATAEVPIQIHNSFLGYDIQYRLKECAIAFSSTSIKSQDVISWVFSGSSFFKDLTNDSTSYAAKRKMYYRGSQMEFFRNLRQQSLGKNNFQLLHGSRYCNPDKYFTVKERKNDCIVIVNNYKIRPNDEYHQSFILEYLGKPDSEIFFRTRAFKIDKFGNCNSNGLISFAGGISDNRIGDMLPLDYKSN